MYKTLIQTLLAGFYAILVASPLEGGGVMIAARQIAFGRGAEKGIYSGPLARHTKIKNLRIYNRALTADEIAHNYNIDKARFGL